MLNKYQRLTFIVLTNFFIGYQCDKCSSFKNITLTVHQRYGDPFNITAFSGCIQRTAFENKTLTEIYIREQNINEIQEDSIRHMVQLKTIAFLRCPIQTISPGLFRNVPRLRTVQISYGNLAAIPAGVFSDLSTLQLLRLHDNKITSIEEAAFSNLVELKKIYMGSNKLRFWQNSWFFNTSNLEVVDFQKNKFQMIPRRAFYGMTKLTRICFSYNEISKIDPEAFKGIRQLNYLGLRYNRLTEFNANIFPNAISVKSFYIDANYLNYLSSEVFKKLTVEEINLDGNPWKCPCLDIIHQWLSDNNATVKLTPLCSGSDIPSCSYPTDFPNICSEKIDEQTTKLYIETLRNLKQPLDKYCARLDP